MRGRKVTGAASILASATLALSVAPMMSASAVVGCSPYTEWYPVAQRTIVANGQDAILATGTVTLTGGCKLVLRGDVKAANFVTANKVLLFTHLTCVRSGGTESGVLTSQNGSPAVSPIINHHHALFVPDITSVYTCRLFARITSWTSSGDSAVIQPTTYDGSGNVTGGSYLDLQPAVASGGQADTATVQLADTTYHDVAMLSNYQATYSAATITVFGDVQLTECYDNGPAECAGIHINNSKGSGTYQTQIFVRQLTATGAICNTTYGTVYQDTVAWAQHHYKRAASLNVPVSTAAGCVRTFKTFTRVYWISGNYGAVVGNPPGGLVYTNTVAVEH